MSQASHKPTEGTHAVPEAARPRARVRHVHRALRGDAAGPALLRRAARGAFVALLVVGAAPGCDREDVRGDMEECIGSKQYPGDECPSAAQFFEEYLSPPPCNQNPGDCRAENVRGPTRKTTVTIENGCCYVYTHIQKPDPIF